MRNMKENGRLRQFIASIFNKVTGDSLLDVLFFVGLLILLYIIMVFDAAVY